MDSLDKAFKKLIKDLKVFNKNLNYVTCKSNEFGFVLFWDIIWCKLRYGITSNEYRIFDFYNLSEEKRNTFMSKRRYEFLNERLVNKKIVSVINNKDRFNLKFKDYLKREVYNIKEMSFKEIEDFLIDNKNVIGRSISASFISSYKEYNLSDYRSPAFMAEDMKENKDYLIEKVFNQHKDLNKINPLVFVNVVSVYNKGVDIVNASIKFRDNKNIITGYIDVDNKCIKGNLKDENGINYKDNYDGLVIPKFKSVIEKVKSLGEELSEIRQVEWSFIIGNRSVYLVDAGVWDDYVFSQIREFLKDDEGLMTYYKKI